MVIDDIHGVHVAQSVSEKEDDPYAKQSCCQTPESLLAEFLLWQLASDLCEEELRFVSASHAFRNFIETTVINRNFSSA